MTNMKRLMVMGGGTAGHIFPGLVVANYLIAKGWKVYWLGTLDRMEAKLVPQYGINIKFIHIQGIRGKRLKTQLIAPIRICYAVRQARRIMCSWKPNVVLGMGGYVSAPGGIAAWSCGIPVVLHEQNAIAGLTNRWLANISCKVLQAFPGAFPDAEVVGNPVREEVLALSDPRLRLHNRLGPIRVLVIGGSQGAQILNYTLPMVAKRLASHIIVWHQVGKGRLPEVKQAYTLAGGGKHQVVEFIDNMADAYTWADVVVCRSGAQTVSELASAGLPALFVPFMHKDRHQYWNARILEQIGAAKIIEQPDFTVNRVSEVLANWSRASLVTMAKRARAAATPDATARVARAVIIAAKN